jgi:hypothetical protein
MDVMAFCTCCGQSLCYGLGWYGYHDTSYRKKQRLQKLQKKLLDGPNKEIDPEDPTVVGPTHVGSALWHLTQHPPVPPDREPDPDGPVSNG